jgi:hypothetical protein
MSSINIKLIKKVEKVSKSQSTQETMEYPPGTSGTVSYVISSGNVVVPAGTKLVSYDGDITPTANIVGLDGTTSTAGEVERIDF